VVNVRVRDDDGVETLRVERRLFPVALPQLPQPLKQPAVNQHPRAVALDQILRAGHSPDRA
jgi:hypothetical protein